MEQNRSIRSKAASTVVRIFKMLGWIQVALT